MLENHYWTNRGGAPSHREELGQGSDELDLWYWFSYQMDCLDTVLVKGASCMLAALNSITVKNLGFWEALRTEIESLISVRRPGDEEFHVRNIRWIIRKMSSDPLYYKREDGLWYRKS